MHHTHSRTGRISMRIRKVVNVVVVLAFWAAVSAPLAAGAQPLADRVPDDALIYVGWAGADTMGPGYAGSHLEAVLKESKFNELISASLPKVFQKIGVQQGDAADDIALVSAICGVAWRHPSALYIGGIDNTNPQG